MSKEDKRLNKIIINKDKYPTELLDMLSRNSDMTDYMLDYLDKKSKVYSNDVGKVKKACCCNMIKGGDMVFMVIV